KYPNVIGKVITPKDSDLENSHQTLQPTRNPLCLCGIYVGIDDRDDFNTSSSTFVPYGVSNLSTISHQQNHQGGLHPVALNPISRISHNGFNTSTSANLNIEHPESRPKTINTLSCKCIYNNLLGDSFTVMHLCERLKIALLRPISQTAGRGNTAIAMGSYYLFLSKR
nr:hypothetical protein [Tanacetum cinerariifolium]